MSGTRGSFGSYDATAGRDTSNEFSRLAQALGSNIQKINSNVTQMQQCVGDIGTSRDNSSLRDKLHQIQHYTGQVAKDSSRMMQDLAHLPHPASASDQRQRKIMKDRLINELSTALKNFQSAQRLSKEKEKESLTRAKQQSHASYSHDPFSTEDDKKLDDLFAGGSSVQQQQQAQAADMDLQLLQEREQNIRQLESDIMDVNQIFKDLGTLVHEQGEMIDSIEANVESTQIRVEHGTTELQKARKYQTAARKKKCIILVVVLVVLAILILILVLALKN